MIKVGLTGGIGSGKSTVAHFFKEHGVPVYFADIEAKKLMETSSRIKNKLIEAFGDQTYTNNTLNRAYLAKVIFNNKKKLAIINSIVHPEVDKHFANWVKQQNTPYCIQENAIIFENKKAANFDYIISVTAPLETRINRVISRDGATKEQVIARINNQWNETKKNELADFVIENEQLSATKNQVKKIHNTLLNFAKKSNFS